MRLPPHQSIRSTRAGPRADYRSKKNLNVEVLDIDGEVLICRGEFTRDDDKAEFRHIDASARALYKRMGFDLRHR